MLEIHIRRLKGGSCTKKENKVLNFRKKNEKIEFIYF